VEVEALGLVVVALVGFYLPQVKSAPELLTP
jgi:hypothetical protein